MSIFSCCVRKVPDVKQLDYRHNGLGQVPAAVFNAERTIEELHVDANQIKALPRELFHCHGLRVLTLSDNEITCIPAAVSSLTNLEKLDVSKNRILELPDSLKTLKYLSVLDASINPLGKLPEGFTQLLNLTQVCLNDCFLEYIPGNFGRLSKLKILELRENHLKTLPQSLSRLTELERLDVGCNEFTELPGNVIGTLLNLLEFWCDANQITNIPKEIGNLKQLMYFDASKNRITELPDEIDGCISLSDLHLTTNLLKTLPHSIGRLSNITTLKVDDNQLLSLPSSIGGLVSLSECVVSANDLEEIPPTIGLLRHLRTLIADENFLSDIPCELGSCSGLTVLSVRSNKLTYLPDEIGRIPRLRVLNLSDNEIKVLPYSLMNLKELHALWLAENQSKALIRLQAATDPETQRSCLTCYLLPQQRMEPIDSYGADDNQSFHPSLWEEQRQERAQIQFQETEEPVTPAQQHDSSAYPKEMRVRSRHVQNEAMRKVTGNGGDDSIADQQTTQSQDKEGKDKARRPSREAAPESIELLEKPQSPHKKHSHRSKPKDRRNSKLSDKDFDLTASTSASLSALNGNLKNIQHESAFTSNAVGKSHNKPKSIQNGHYNASSTRSINEQRHINDIQRTPSGREVQRTPSGRELQRAPSARSSIAHSQSFPASQHPPPYGSHQSLRGQPYDRYLTSQLQLQINTDTNDAKATSSKVRQSRQSLNQSEERGSTARLTTGSNNNSQAVINQEDTFGIFTSDEDPKLYQRRFKYYQRMRKHRKNPEVRSDLGYYHGQYNGTPNKPVSESGHRHRRPLQQGHDGFDQWERFSQRSVGDGYASDVEGFNNGGKRMHHIAKNMQSPYRPSQKSLNDSRVSMNGNSARPAVPPSYNKAMAKRTEIKQVENTPFPAPPPYKPPGRDTGPDGASNDGIPRTSPSLDDTPGRDEDVPFKLYSESRLQNVTATVKHFDGATPPMNNGYPPPNSRPPYMTSTPMVSHYATPGVVTQSDRLNDDYYSPIERRPSRGSRHDSLPNQTNDSQRPTSQRTSFYNSSYKNDGTVDSEYVAQISKSIGRLGYNRESDKRLSRPPAQFSGDVTDTVPPPTSFGDPQADHSHTNQNDSMYGIGDEMGSGNYAVHQALPANGTNSRLPTAHRSHKNPLSSHHRLSDGQVATGSNYSYLPPPNRKSPKLPHKQIIASGLELDQPTNSTRIGVTIIKNPGLGFSVAGGVGCQGNPYRPSDEGIYVTKLHANGAATGILQPGDKILTVNGTDFTHLEHNTAVNMLKRQPTQVNMTIERAPPNPSDV